MKFAKLALLALLLHSTSFAATPTMTHQQITFLKAVIPFIQSEWDETPECGDSDNDGICDTQSSED